MVVCLVFNTWRLISESNRSKRSSQFVKHIFRKSIGELHHGKVAATPSAKRSGNILILRADNNNYTRPSSQYQSGYWDLSVLCCSSRNRLSSKNMKGFNIWSWTILHLGKASTRGMSNWPKRSWESSKSRKLLRKTQISGIFNLFYISEKPGKAVGWPPTVVVEILNAMLGRQQKPCWQQGYIEKIAIVCHLNYKS